MRPGTMTRGQPEEVSVWTGTADTPGPGDVVQAGAAVTISVGVKPADLSNTVEVRYRISEGPTEAAPAKWLRNDRSRGIQYFQAQLPAFRSGDLVSYLAVCRCAGREAYSSGGPNGFGLSFRVADVDESPIGVSGDGTEEGTSDRTAAGGERRPRVPSIPPYALGEEVQPPRLERAARAY